MSSDADATEEDPRALLYLIPLLSGIAIAAGIYGSESLDLLRNSDMLDLLGVALPLYGGLSLLGLYGLIGAGLRSRATKAQPGESERALISVGLRHIPWFFWIPVAALLIPLILPPIRRAPSVASFARRATSFWLLPAALIAGMIGWEGYTLRARGAEERAIEEVYREALIPGPGACAACHRAEAMSARFEERWGRRPWGILLPPACRDCP